MFENILNRRRICSYISDKRGNVAVVAALMGFPLVFMTGLTVDYSNISRETSELQELSDAAALYSVLGIEDLSVHEQILEREATASLFANYENEASEITIDLDKSTNTLEVTMSKEVDTSFASLMGADTVKVSAFSQVTYQEIYTDPNCIYTTSGSDRGSITLTGGSTITAAGCSIQVNSDNDRAVILNGNDSGITAETICVVGGVSEGNGDIEATIIEFCQSEEDPFADLETPPVGRCNFTDASFSGPQDGRRNIELHPGVYCGGISANSGLDVVLNPGTYILKDGDINLTGNATLTGDGVLLYFIGEGVELGLSGGGQITLTAPAPADAEYLPNFVIYMDTESSIDSQSRLSGGSNTNLEGIVYLGEGELTISGDGAINDESGLSIIIASTIVLTGGAELFLGYDPNDTDLEIPEFLFDREITAYLSK